MREIKFRGKRICDRLWLYGNLIQSNVGNVTINGTNKYCRVDPKTVGQYTGLHDKNGKEIYEGDIVKDRYSFVETVKWNEYKFEIGKIKPTQKSLDKYEYEIIGNIYETNLEELK